MEKVIIIDQKCSRINLLCFFIIINWSHL